MLIQSQRDGHRKTKLEGITVSTSTCSRTEWDNGPKFLETHVHRLWAFLPVCRVLFYDCVTFDLFLECRKRIEFFFSTKNLNSLRNKHDPCVQKSYYTQLCINTERHTHRDARFGLFSASFGAIFGIYEDTWFNSGGLLVCTATSPPKKFHPSPLFSLSLSHRHLNGHVDDALSFRQGEATNISKKRESGTRSTSSTPIVALLCAEKIFPSLRLRQWLNRWRHIFITFLFIPATNVKRLPIICRINVAAWRIPT